VRQAWLVDKRTLDFKQSTLSHSHVVVSTSSQRNRDGLSILRAGRMIAQMTIAKLVVIT
jgi:hypothetical protein